MDARCFKECPSRVGCTKLSFKYTKNQNLTYSTYQGSQINCLAQTGLTTLCIDVQLVSGVPPPYDETEHLTGL